ncbi:hypothetical protein Vretimale_181 [Volvox reticuliferus]|nr:hypothetical protein Vretimale_181 [Volvox reticuliferus]
MTPTVLGAGGPPAECSLQAAMFSTATHGSVVLLPNAGMNGDAAAEADVMDGGRGHVPLSRVSEPAGVALTDSGVVPTYTDPGVATCGGVTPLQGSYARAQAPEAAGLGPEHTAKGCGVEITADFAGAVDPAHFVSASGGNGGGAVVKGGGALVNGCGALVNGGGALVNGGARGSALVCSGGGALVNCGGASVNGGGALVNGGSASVNGGGALVNGGGASVNDGGRGSALVCSGGGALVNGGSASVNGGGRGSTLVCSGGGALVNCGGALVNGGGRGSALVCSGGGALVNGGSALVNGGGGGPSEGGITVMVGSPCNRSGGLSAAVTIGGFDAATSQGGQAARLSGVVPLPTTQPPQLIPNNELLASLPLFEVPIADQKMNRIVTTQMPVAPWSGRMHYQIYRSSGDA